MAESEELLAAKSVVTLAASQLDQQQCQQHEEKVSLKVDKVGLEDEHDGDEWSSCSDRSFETVGTDKIEIPARPDSCASASGSQTSTNNPIKKRRRRGKKGGSRHRKYQLLPGKELQHISQLSQKALYLKEKDRAAALNRFADEQDLVLFPAAPFNSTQYIMEEYDKNYPLDQENWASSRSASSSPPHKTSCSVPFTPVETNREVIHCVKRDRRDQEFTDSLISAKAECLQSLPKAELVKHFIDLEEKVSELKKKVAQAEQQKREKDDLYSPESGDVNNPRVSESVFNSENSLSSNNEDVDLSGAKQQHACLNESSMVICDDTAPPSN